MELRDCIAEVILAKKVWVTAFKKVSGNLTTVKLKKRQRKINYFFPSFISKRNMLTTENFMETCKSVQGTSAEPKQLLT